MLGFGNAVGQSYPGGNCIYPALGCCYRSSWFCLSVSCIPNCWIYVQIGWDVVIQPHSHIPPAAGAPFQFQRSRQPPGIPGRSGIWLFSALVTDFPVLHREWITTFWHFHGNTSLSFQAPVSVCLRSDGIGSCDVAASPEKSPLSPLMGFAFLLLSFLRVNLIPVIPEPLDLSLLNNSLHPNQPQPLLDLIPLGKPLLYFPLGISLVFSALPTFLFPGTHSKHLL